MIDNILADHLLLSDSRLERWLLRYSQNSGEGRVVLVLVVVLVALAEHAVEVEVAVEVAIRSNLVTSRNGRKLRTKTPLVAHLASFHVLINNTCSFINVFPPPLRLP
jgi:hypothetical protein